MTVTEILRAAAGEVRKGWTKFVREDSLGNVCALGALDRTIGCSSSSSTFHRVDVQRPDVVRALARTLLNPHVECLEGTHLIAAWNNAPGQTAANVALTMEFAALCAEQEASVSRSEHQDANAVAEASASARTLSRA